MDRIKNLKAYEILNAKGNPTVEAVVETESGIIAAGSVPSGTSTGKYEAYELHDGGTRYGGRGVRKAVENVNSEIAGILRGMSIANLEDIDNAMIELDGTENKSRLGANAILAVSVAAAKARAAALGLPVYRSLSEKSNFSIPDVIATVISGGEFSPSGLDFEDYLYILHDFCNFSEELEALVIMRKQLEKNLVKKYGVFPEDGGALAAPIQSTEEAFDIMLSTADECGFKKNVSLGLDVAASELFDIDTKIYKVKGGMKADALAGYYDELIADYPLTYIEDGFNEDDTDGFRLLTKYGNRIQNVGDDLFTSNVKRLESYHDVANGLLLKINQIGTVTEAIAAANYAQREGMDVTVSLRSGETTDDFIADLSVAIGAKQIKLGSPVRAERNAKYNRLLRIAEELER